MEKLIKEFAEELRGMQLDLDNLFEKIKEVEIRIDRKAAKLDINSKEEHDTLVALNKSSNRLKEARRFVYDALDSVLDAGDELEYYRKKNK